MYQALTFSVLHLTRTLTHTGSTVAQLALRGKSSIALPHEQVEHRHTHPGAASQTQRCMPQPHAHVAAIDAAKGNFLQPPKTPFPGSDVAAGTPSHSTPYHTRTHTRHNRFMHSCTMINAFK